MAKIKKLNSKRKNDNSQEALWLEIKDEMDE